MINQKDKSKIGEIIICIINECKCNDLTDMKLWKILYFCDADFYEKNKKKISNINYYKNEHGPTPHYKDILLVLEYFSDYFVKTSNKYKIIKEYDDYKYINKEEIRYIKSICEKYGHMTASQLRRLSHMDTPYLGKKYKEKIDFKFIAYRDNDKKYDSVKNNKNNTDISDEVALKILKYVSNS